MRHSECRHLGSNPSPAAVTEKLSFSEKIMVFEQKTIDALKWIVDIFNKYNIPYRIGGGFAAKIYGSPRPLNDIDFGISGISLANSLTDILDMNVQGVDVKIMNPRELKNYKKELNGEHQLMDIQAIDNYLSTHKL